jgi:hypothetical protein
MLSWLKRLWSPKPQTEDSPPLENMVSRLKGDRIPIWFRVGNVWHEIHSPLHFRLWSFIAEIVEDMFTVHRVSRSPD